MLKAERPDSAPTDMKKLRGQGTPVTRDGKISQHVLILPVVDTKVSRIIAPKVANVTVNHIRFDPVGSAKEGADLAVLDCLSWWSKLSGSMNTLQAAETKDLILQAVAVLCETKPGAMKPLRMLRFRDYLGHDSVDKALKKAGIDPAAFPNPTPEEAG
jgi:hypothetical protein